MFQAIQKFFKNNESKLSVQINQLREVIRRMESAVAFKGRHLTKTQHATYLTLRQRFDNCVFDAMQGFQSKELAIKKLTLDIQEGELFLQGLSKT